MLILTLGSMFLTHNLVIKSIQTGSEEHVRSTTNSLQRQLHGSERKEACCQEQPLEFNLQDPHGRMRDSAPTNYPLTFPPSPQHTDERERIR